MVLDESSSILKVSTRSKVMKSATIFAIVFISIAVIACGLFAPAAPTQRVETQVSVEPETEPSAVAVSETPVAAQTSIPVIAPTATTAKLKLDVVQSQAWTDRDGNFRVNVLMRNPYDFPVAPTFRGSANLMNGDGKFLRAEGLYFLDGISGGYGFILPGETIAANACFTCEKTPLSEAWNSVEFEVVIADASSKWNYSTDVQAAISSVTFDGDSPIFWVAGTVKNNTNEIMGRVSARVFVYDKSGNLVGAAEVSSWDVAPGATVNFKGYGIGNSPDGAIKSEITVLGVNY